MSKTQPNTSTRHDPSRDNQTSQRTIRRLRTLRDFYQKLAMFRNDINFFKQIFCEMNRKGTDYTAKMLTSAGELAYHKNRRETYDKLLHMYTRRYTLNKELDPGPTPAEFDDMMYSLADEIWSYYLSKW